MAVDLTDCLRLREEDNGLRAVLIVHPGYDPSELNVETLKSQIPAMGIQPQAIDSQAVEALVKECLQAPDETHEALVAHGTAPEHGKPGSFEYTAEIQEQFDLIEHRKTILEALGPEEEPESNDHINFREQSAFVIVEKGQQVGTRTEPTCGIDGCDVFGGTLAAKTGADHAKKLDKTLKVQPNGAVVATIAGVVIDDGQRVRISPILEVHGAVDYSTGNISFPGDVLVEKGVKDQFEVRSGKSVQVRGLVEAARIEARENVILLGGMAARTKGSVRAGRHLRARYLDAARVEVGGSCSVENEASGCDMTVCGSLCAEGAVVRGGIYRAAMGAQIKTLGAAGGAKTELIVGRQAEQDELLCRIAALIPELESAAADADARYQTLAKNITKMTASQAEELTELQFAVSEKRQQAEAVKTRAGKLSELILKTVRPKVHIKGEIFRGVTIWLRRVRLDFTSNVKGPVDLLLDENDRVQLLESNSGRELAIEGVARVHMDNSVLSMPQMRELAAAA